MKLTRRTIQMVLILALVPSLAVAAKEGDQRTESMAGAKKTSARKQAGETPRVLNAPGLSKGVDAIIAEVRKREVDLALREQGVAERERAVVELESMIEKRAMDLDRIRQEVEDRIAGWTSQGRDRIAQLSEVYASMAPQEAGRLLNKLDLDLAVGVIRGMKKKSSAGVLAAMRPDRALQVSRRMLKPLNPSTDSPAARKR